MPPSLEEQLLHPVNLKIARKLRAGRNISIPNQVSLQIPWSSEQLQSIQDRITSWLATGDTNKLIELIRDQPTAIAHPVVFRQIFHLRQIVRTIDEDPEDPTIPPETRRAAGMFLLQILSAWMPQLLPGHTVTRMLPKKRGGAPAKWEKDEQLSLLQEFNELRDALDTIGEQCSWPLDPHRGESRARFLQRMCGVVEQLNRQLPYPYKTYENLNAPLLPVPKDFQGDTATWNMLSRTYRRYVPLPIDVAKQIVRQGWSTQRLRKDRLLCSLLSYHVLGDTRKWNSIRGVVERAEADFPEFDQRRLSCAHPQSRPARI
jgi:hypothetical protein